MSTDSLHPEYFSFWSYVFTSLFQKQSIVLSVALEKQLSNSVQTCVSTGMLYNQSKCSTQCLCSSKENSRRHLPYTAHQSADI